MAKIGRIYLLQVFLFLKHVSRLLLLETIYGITFGNVKNLSIRLCGWNIPVLQISVYLQINLISLTYISIVLEPNAW